MFARPLNRFCPVEEKPPVVSQQKSRVRHEVSAVQRERNARAKQLCCGALRKRRLGSMHR
jgi:hypothetical protein